MPFRASCHMPFRKLIPSPRRLWIIFTFKSHVYFSVFLVIFLLISRVNPSTFSSKNYPYQTCRQKHDNLPPITKHQHGLSVYQQSFLYGNKNSLRAEKLTYLTWRYDRSRSPAGDDFIIACEQAPKWGIDWARSAGEKEKYDSFFFFFFLSPLDRATLADLSLVFLNAVLQSSVPKCSLLFIQIEKMLYHPVACIH